MAIQSSSDPSILEGQMVTVADDKSKCGHKIWKFNRSGRVLICHCYLLSIEGRGGAWFGCNGVLIYFQGLSRHASDLIG